MGLINNYINKKIGEYLTREVPDIDPSATIVRDEHFKLLENRCWFMASNANELENFYKTTQPSGRIFSSQSSIIRFKVRFQEFTLLFQS
jgi:hypothetical protein